MSARRQLLLVVLAGLALRCLLLWVRGDYLVYDEGYYLLLARSLRAGRGFTLNGLPHVSLSPLQPLLVAALSATGVPDLWVSRALAAVAGALLVVPSAYLGREWFGPRAGLWAAAFVAVSPGLLTFLPFFPGESWNLYFGSEPLYLLLAMCALAAGWRAVHDQSNRWLAATGGLSALCYLTRLEGAVLGVAIGVAALGLLVARRRGMACVPGMVAGVLIGSIVVAPYLFYLHGVLGRWAVSGRVQAAAVAEQASVPSPDAQGGGTRAGPSSAVNAFIWGGDREALWRALNALDATGEHMASQYWGVVPRSARGTRPGVPTATARDAATDAPRAGGQPSAPSPPQPSDAPRTFPTWYVVGRALMAVAPWWFLVFAAGALAWLRPPWEIIAWHGPAALAMILPSVLAYVEPRVLLLLVPIACIFAGAAAVRVGALLAERIGRAWLATAVPAAVAAALLIPTGRAVSGAWNQDTPLQRVAAARRAVGEYLGTHLAKDARIVSWHPAIALYAQRDWRVLPYDSFERIIGYARAQGADVVVFSRFEPSPLRNPPRPFTAVLPSGAAIRGDSIRLDPVDETMVLFVGRLAGSR